MRSDLLINRVNRDIPVKYQPVQIGRVVAKGLRERMFQAAA
jgi:hypothetical protein